MTNKDLREHNSGKHRMTRFYDSLENGTRTTDHKTTRISKKERNKLKKEIAA